MSMSLPMLSPSSHFAVYVTWAQAQPNLDAEEERKLFQNFIEYRDAKAAKKLIFSHLKYVIHIAKGFLGYGLALQDLVQEGNLGLMKAVQRFDLSHAVRFSTFAYHWIRSSILDYVFSNAKTVSLSKSKTDRSLFFNMRQRFQDDRPSEENFRAIAHESGASLQQARSMYGLLSSKEVPLEMPLPYAEGGSLTLMDTLPSEGSDPLEQVAQANSREHLGGCLEKTLQTLNPREAWIIKHRWLVEEGQRATLQDIANHCGVSIERARQLEVQTLKKMKKHLDQQQALPCELDGEQA